MLETYFEQFRILGFGSKVRCGGVLIVPLTTKQLVKHIKHIFFNSFFKNIAFCIFVLQKSACGGDVLFYIFYKNHGKSSNMCRNMFFLAVGRISLPHRAWG